MKETKCFNATTPDWGPLERAVRLAGMAPEVVGDFMWLGEWREGEHSYKHFETRNYARLGAETPAAECVAQLRTALSMERTWGATMDRQAVTRG